MPSLHYYATNGSTDQGTRTGTYGYRAVFRGWQAWCMVMLGQGLGWFLLSSSAGLFKVSSLQSLPRQISNTQWGENRAAEGGMEG